MARLLSLCVGTIIETGLLQVVARRSFCAMKTLTISEATSNLAGWLQQAVAGEEIGIRSGDTLVVLRPLSGAAHGQEPEPPSPREALRHLQENARLTPAQAESYLNEVRAERLAAEDRGAA